MIKLSRKLDMLMKELEKTSSETFFHSLRRKNMPAHSLMV